MVFKKIVSAVLTAAMAISFTGLSALAETTYTLGGVAHVQDQGDTEAVWNGETGELTLGSRGLSRRLEKINITFENNTGYGGGLEYRVHIQDYGWTEWLPAGTDAGTAGQSKRLEGIEIRLTGDLAAYYNVLYRAHIQDYGDAQGWVANGALAGTTGESKRVEEIVVKLEAKSAPSFSTSVIYHVHRQDYGWESDWKANGAVSGTTGQAKRLEAITLSISDPAVSGGIKYRTHVQDIGWQDWKCDGDLSGTTGMGKRLEAIQIELTGEMASNYDVYYRVHVEGFGWLGWAVNGESAGTSGLSLRLEAIQVMVAAKGSAAPESVAGISSVRPECSFSDADFDRIVSEGLYSGWITAGGSTYYIIKNADGTGSLANGVVNIDGTDFVFENGKLAPNQRIVSNNKIYYTDGSGNVYRIVDGDKPMVALTFDDGPTQYTSQILDILEANGGKATFFVMGCLVSGYPGTLQRAYNMGCQIGSHTWDHPTLTKCSADKILQELNSTDAAVQAIIGCPTSIMRPPGGAQNGTVASIIAQTGKPLILWSVDTRDWENKNSQMIINNVLNNVKDGSIVLMHDRLECTAVACQTIIPTLTAQGYQLVTVEELALLNGGMVPGGVYRSF